MLFWSFVLAFVLSILYYMSPVHNTVQIEDKPLADTMVSAFVNAHQAAKRLTYTNKPIKIDCRDDEGNPIEVKDPRVITFTYKEKMQGLKTNTTSGFLTKKGTLSALDSGRKFSDGTLANISLNEIKKILPGLDYEDENGVLKNKLETYNITSAFACITDAAVGDGTTNAYLTFDCQGGKSKGVGDYVITYMQAPTEEHSIIARNELWRSGVLRRTKGSHECGVLSLISENKDNRTRQKYDENAEYVLDNSRRFTVSVPKAITDVLKDSTLKNDMDSGYLLFCITPMDDIRASFEWKCDKGYGKYKIMDGTTGVQDCTCSTTE